MKLNIIKYRYKGVFSVVLFSALMFTSCNNFLDEQPPSGTIIEENSFENFADVQSALYGAYRFTTYNWFVIALNAWAGDNAQRSRDNGGIGTIYFNWTYNSSNAVEVEAIYLRAYNLVLAVNKILDNIDLVEGGTEDEKNEVKAQCYALRAMAHFDLSRLYAAKYTATGDGGHLGIPYLTESTNASSLPSQNTVKEVYNLAIQDLTTAYDLFTDYAVSNPTFISKVAVDALLQRLYLYKEDWAKVIEIGNRIIDNSGLMLASGSDYINMYTPSENPGEFIFKVGLPAGVNFSIPLISGTSNMGDIFAFGTSVNNYIPNAEFAASFDANDIRPDILFTVMNGSPTLDKDFVNKYSGTGFSGTTDQPYARLSEVYLSMAEAYFELNQPAEARAKLDAVRAARISGYVSIGENGTALRDAIRTERRKELAYEGHRFWDLSRWGLGVDRGTTCVDLATGNCTLAADDFRFVMPIPQHEMNANPNMVQNTGF
ncbi:MAG: RagB/SusD family nutrient uptake outer membrane protein [Bacteroidetes bacterium]|nr:RagB/SusD family nutrient uptake outer membrane protein [Bacteroidota bacterium]